MHVYSLSKHLQSLSIKTIVVEENVFKGVSEDGNPWFPAALTVKLSVPSGKPSRNSTKEMDTDCMDGRKFLI